jgi:hypothetical protein
MTSSVRKIDILAHFACGLGLLRWDKLLYILGSYAVFSYSANFVPILNKCIFIWAER